MQLCHLARRSEHIDFSSAEQTAAACWCTLTLNCIVSQKHFGKLIFEEVVSEQLQFGATSP